MPAHPQIEVFQLCEGCPLDASGSVGSYLSHGPVAGDDEKDRWEDATFSDSTGNGFGRVLPRMTLHSNL